MTNLKTHHIDTRIRIPTPEFTVFHSQLAGPSIRLLAILFDHFLLLTVMFVIVIFFNVLDIISFSGYIQGAAGIAQFMIFLLLFIVYWFFFFLQELFLRGRTIGKMAFKLRVISIDGTSLNFTQVLLRNLLRFADMFPTLWSLIPTYFIGIVSCFLDPLAFRRLGDLVAGTIVIKESKVSQMSVQVSKDPKLHSLASHMKLNHTPSTILTQAINDFAESIEQMHPLRATEIAQKFQEKIRAIFNAKNLECTPTDLLLATHVFLNSATNKEILQNAPLAFFTKSTPSSRKNK